MQEKKSRLLERVLHNFKRQGLLARVFLINGVKIEGVIMDYDDDYLIVNNPNQVEPYGNEMPIEDFNLINKQVISTIKPAIDNKKKDKGNGY